MATNVVMPQMGESIAEGTIVRWIKKVGESVDRDEPLFEISTDKVDAEIPSPVAGVLAEIRVKEGETVPVNSVVAVIEGAQAARSAAPTTTAPATGSAPAGPAAPPQRPAPTPVPPSVDGSRSAPSPATTPPVKETPPPASPQTTARPEGELSAEELIRTRSSPLVRKLAKEHGVDIAQIQGTGISGRVTKDDILKYLESATPVTRPTSGTATAVPVPPREPALARAMPARPEGGSADFEAPSFSPGETTATVPMSTMRRKIAEHMTLSRRTSAHVHSVFEVNFGQVRQIRDARKAEYEREGAKLTYLPFIVKAAVDALRAMPVVNASVDGTNILYHKDINIGIAVALDWGLIVPVIRQADERTLLGLCRAIADLAGRARNKQLNPDAVTGGTFTITNPGSFGASLGMPIINQPQVAILGVGHVEQRPVVIGDAIAIRPMAYLTLGYDHRLIDGAVADRFMAFIKHSLENWDPADA